MSGDGALQWRPIGQADVAPWAVLLNDIQVADGGSDFYSEQEVRETLDDPEIDYPYGSVTVCAGDALAGYGLLTARTSADPVHEMRYSGGVHPDFRGHGLGGQLLAWAEKAAVPLHEERFPGQPLTLTGHCLASNAAALELYEGRGYERVREFYEMSRDLAEPVTEHPLPADVELRTVTPDRLEDARLVRNEAFRDHWGSTEATAEGWAHTASSESARPELSFLAYAAGEPAGTILSMEFAEYQARTGRREVYIAIVATRRAARKRGIASALVARVLATAQAAGYDQATLGVDSRSQTGALGLYERAGFRVANVSVTVSKPLLTA
jgi:mycothiol synthase